jgi:[ribosomal protein S5]-alanine N-acetyltransferase
VTVLETERLVLRELVPDDAPFMLELLNDPAYILNIADRGVRDVEGARRYLEERWRASYAEHGFGLWVVVHRETGASTGLCGLVRRDGLDDVDIGYAFLPAFRGRGFALESALGVKAHARDVVGLTRLVAIVTPGNTRSIHVLERLGMRFERTLRLPGDASDVALYATEL